MRVKIHDSNLEYLALEALNLCPEDLSSCFGAGYIAFVEYYFENIQRYIELQRIGDQSEISLDLAKDSTMSDIKIFREDIVTSEHHKGMSFALRMCNYLIERRETLNPSSRVAS